MKPRQNRCPCPDERIFADTHTATKRRSGRNMHTISKIAFVIDNCTVIDDHTTANPRVSGQHGLRHHMRSFAND
ncbi:hypothetical protein ATO1_15475 [Phaeobacter sp. 22II1-1F12B]|nr:hypothetical protein ATO1_15475 [Phaeobacter sp. 22II1-1F12B]